MISSLARLKNESYLNHRLLGLKSMAIKSGVIGNERNMHPRSNEVDISNYTCMQQQYSLQQCEKPISYTNVVMYKRRYEKNMEHYN